ncbi:hypothetical protein ACROYT_G040788 [Oculina patagonica]
MSSRKLRRVAGIPPEIVERLAKHRIISCKDVLQKNCLELLKCTGASYQEVLEIQRAVGKAIIPKVQTALALFERSGHQQSFFPTSLNDLDKQLHGGLTCGTITEIAGPAGCGKTQFCIMLSLLATLPQDRGGLDASVIYIDTEAAFSATRLIEMASNRFPDIFSTNESLLQLSERIHVYWESTCSSLWDRLQRLEEEIISKRVKLIILDSMASLVRKEFDSRVSRNLSERTALLSKEAAILKYLAETFHIPVVVTNQITTRFLGASGSAAFQDVDGADAEPDEDDGSHVTAALGNTWSHAVNTRLIVQYLDEKFRQVSISKSPVAPFASFVYTIHAKGIVLERQDTPGQERGGNPSLQAIQVRSAF